MPSKPSKPSSDAGLQGDHASCACSATTATLTSPKAPLRIASHQNDESASNGLSNLSTDPTSAFLIEIPEPNYLSLYVREMRPNGALKVTYERLEAMQFTTKDLPTLISVQAEVSTWPGNSGPVRYVRKGLS